MLPGTVCFLQTVGADSEAVLKADRACCDTGMVGEAASDLLERLGFPGVGEWEDMVRPWNPEGLAGLQSPEVNGFQGRVVFIVLSPS